MRLYLEAVEVIVDDEEQLKRTRSYVEEFMRPDGIGAKLQQLLIEKQQREDNWVWFIMSCIYISLVHLFFPSFLTDSHITSPIFQAQQLCFKPRSDSIFFITY